MTKAAEAFRTISEVAEALGIPAHVLRFWESKFPQVKPVKRAGGRRYYRPADVALLAGIKSLLHDQGMTIRGVQKILREQGAKHLTDLAAGASGAETKKPGSLATKPAPARAQPTPMPRTATVPPAPTPYPDEAPMLFDAPAVPMPDPRVRKLHPRQPEATAPATVPMPWAARVRALAPPFPDPAPYTALYARLADLRARVAARAHS
jgi:DNA-binding transcriptional MerR regulator